MTTLESIFLVAFTLCFLATIVACAFNIINLMEAKKPTLKISFSSKHQERNTLKNGADYSENHSLLKNDSLGKYGIAS